MKVNEIFYSLQGEGHFTGTPAVFVRLSGCNLRCPFCDTLHEEGEQMTEDEIVAQIEKYPARHVVVTGGEPLLQLSARLTQILHKAGYFIQIETNGTQRLSEGCEVDWITCSPKNDKLAIQRIDELKALFADNEPMMYSKVLEAYPNIKELRLQPLYTGDAIRDKEIIENTIEYILQHPQWKLSLQTHKILGVR